MFIYVSGALGFALFFSISTGCDDIDSQLCADISGKYPGLCNDTCLSNMCQRTCGLCRKYINSLYHHHCDSSWWLKPAKAIRT